MTIWRLMINFGDKVLAFETPFCNELDVFEELELLEFQLQKNYNSDLINYLKGVK